MNHYLQHHFATAREIEVQMLVEGRRVPDEWQLTPRRSLADALGESLVQLGARLLTDRGRAERIERGLSPKAA